MVRSRRPLALFLTCVWVCASLAVTQRPPLARAAGPTFTVTTPRDAFSDPALGCDATPQNCTLRQAINSANEASNSTIDFLIDRSDPGYADFPNGAWIITPTIALPPLGQDSTLIDGSTQTNRVGNDNNDGAEIIISGVNVNNAGGIVINSNNNTVRGIGIMNFKGNNTPGSLKGVGIEIYGSGNTIQGNYIGLGGSPNGTIAAANVDAGIIIYGANNLIGGDVTSQTTQFNVISGNTGDGILINGGDTNTIAGNYIGIGFLNNIKVAIPNGGNGINIRNGALAALYAQLYRRQRRTGHSAQRLRGQDEHDRR
jgi:hypothetical protein